MNTGIVAGVVIIAAFVFLRFGRAMSSLKSIDSPTLRSWLKDKNKKFVLIDVRRPDETAQGKIANAKEINVLAPDFKQKVSQLDKSKTYVIYCRSGQRSARASMMMNKLGFKEVYNLTGGYMGYQS